MRLPKIMKIAIVVKLAFARSVGNCWFNPSPEEKVSLASLIALAVHGPCNRHEGCPKTPLTVRGAGYLRR